MRRPTNILNLMKYISQKEAIQIDKELVEKYKFTIPQLIELAGLSVSQAIYEVYKPNIFSKVLVCSGPGNNGGDGFVVCRNLKLMGYDVSYFCPKLSDKEYIVNLHSQMPLFDVRRIQSEEEFTKIIENNSYNLIVDAFFGFSFKPPLKAPFDSIVSRLCQSSTPICSIDVPSGWIVDSTDNETSLDISICLKPQMIVALSVPKLCLTSFSGKYLYLGGRFLPPLLVKQFQLEIPSFPEDKMIVNLKI